jgi:hypothetical protein
MINNWPNASANFWVNRQGVWYCVGTGIAWHAGVVAAGMPNNFNSFGVETDQTVNETPSPVMLDSVTRGFAALLKEMGRNSASYWFHKTIAPMRKQDPWLGPSSANSANWNNELMQRRIAVQTIMDGGSSSKPNPTPPQDEDDEVNNEDIETISYQAAQKILDALAGVKGGGKTDGLTDKGLAARNAIARNYLGQPFGTIKKDGKVRDIENLMADTAMAVGVPVFDPKA